MKSEDRLAKLEYEYGLLSRNALECIWVYDIEDSRFTYISPNVFKLRGITVEEAMQESLANAVPPETYREAMENTRLMVKRYRQGERREALLTAVRDQQIYTKDGQIRQIEVTVKLTEHPQTGALEVLGITRDITERKLLEEKLNQAIEIKTKVIARLEKSERALQRLAKELDHKNRALREVATRDALTGVFNRYYFDRKMTEEAQRCQRYRYPLSMILLDIDDFKSINDTLGHEAGDLVQSTVAHALERSIRRQDILSRWGGDEFVILLPHTDLSSACVVAEKLKATLERITHTKVCKRVTASFGVTEFLHGETRASCFRRADYALFRSKSKGKRCVTGLKWVDALPYSRVTLAWNAAFESGNLKIDNRHKRIILLANQALNSVGGNRRENEALDALLKLLKIHFQKEERILVEAEYPNAAEHAALHRMLLTRANVLYRQYREGSASTAALFSFLLSEIIVGHMCREDLHFFPYLKQLNA